MAKSRRKAREAALRALYQIDIGQITTLAGLLDMRERSELSAELWEYAEQMVKGVQGHSDEIDSLISACLIDWELDRIAVVDRNVMRMACFELLHVPSIPPAVSINEAIELAKKYSTAESGKFVNGVLGRLLAETPKAAWNPSMGEAPEEPAAEEAVAEEEVSAEQAADLLKVGLWKVRRDAD